jgi:sec-independent protein translocase protein TatC
VLPLWGISDYIGMILTLLIVTGICFELPVLLIALLRSGVLSIKAMERSRRYFMVAFFVAAAIITPPDVFTQVIVGLLLCAMYESALIIAKILRRKTDEQA